MKKSIIIIGLLISTFTELTLANNYVWLHGLNDDYNCWKIYNEALTPGIGIQSFYYSIYHILLLL